MMYDLRNFAKRYYPFIIFFAVMLVMHLVMGLNGDDIRYAKVLSNTTLADYMVYRYRYWSSRILIESVLVVLARENMIIWKILDCVIYTLGIYYAIKLVNRKGDVHIAFLGVLLFLMCPFHEMATAGWMATTLNYLWCFSLAMISMIPLIDLSYGEETQVWKYAVSVVALLYAVNQEQSCALIFGLNLVFLAKCLIKRQNLNRYNVFVVLVSLASLVFILTCPGNTVRYAAEMSYWYPQFAQYGILEKLYLGVIPTFALLLEQKIIFPIFYLILSMVLIAETQNVKLKRILYINVFIIIFLTVFKTCLDISTLSEVFHSMAPFTAPFESIVNLLPPLRDALIVMGLKTVPDINVLTVLIAVYLLVSSVVMLYRVLGVNAVILFLAGFMSKFITAFSPTVFASGPRTLIFFYFILVGLILMLIVHLTDSGKITEKWDRLATGIFILMAAVNYILVFAIVMVKYSIF